MASAPREIDRPAFYALRSGGWRDLVTLLHPPYTAWHLSYVAIGAAAAPHIYAIRLAAALAAFLLAVGISAHALDELNGRPLQTKLSRGTLIGLAVAGLIGAVGIGIAGVAIVSPLLAPLVLAGGLLVPAYNLELAQGRFHNDTWFALAWGGFPGFHRLLRQRAHRAPRRPLATAACCLVSVAQRELSTPVRRLRRATTEITGQQHLQDGTVIELTRAGLSAPLEAALRALWLAMVLLAVGLVAVRL